MISAKRDSDLAGYMPLSEGSTILDKASISCSCGVAHLTNDCSALVLELPNTHTKQKKTESMALFVG